MTYAIKPKCTSCKHANLLNIKETQYDKNLTIRCTHCKSLFSVAVPKKNVFIKKQEELKKRQEKQSKKKELPNQEPPKTVIGKIKGEAPIKEEAPVLMLEVKQNALTAAQKFSIKQKVTVIGRKSPSSSADIQMETTDMRISRTHFVIEKKANNNFTITDKTSGNGTYVNNEKLDNEEVIYLNDGDIIGVGKTKIEVRVF